MLVPLLAHFFSLEAGVRDIVSDALSSESHLLEHSSLSGNSARVLHTGHVDSHSIRCAAFGPSKEAIHIMLKVPFGVQNSAFGYCDITTQHGESCRGFGLLYH